MCVRGLGAEGPQTAGRRPAVRGPKARASIHRWKATDFRGPKARDFHPSLEARQKSFEGRRSEAEGRGVWGRGPKARSNARAEGPSMHPSLKARQRIFEGRRPEICTHPSMHFKSESRAEGPRLASIPQFRMLFSRGGPKARRDFQGHL